MPAAGVIGAVASVAGSVGSMMSGSDSGDSADAYAGQAGQLAATQAKIAQASWDRYLEQFAPLEDELIKEVKTPYTESQSYLNRMADIKQGYANTMGNVRRTMAGRFPSGSNLEVAPQMSLQRSQIKDLATADAAAEEARLNRMYQVSGLGRNLSTSAMSGLGSASSTYGSLANMYGNAANSAYSSAGNSLGNLSQMYMLSNYGKSGSGGGSSWTAPTWTNPFNGNTY